MSSEYVRVDVFEFLFLILYVVFAKKAVVKSGLPLDKHRMGRPEKGKPLIVRLDEIESELRFISSRVDNSVRVDDKVKLEKELLLLRNSVSDFSAKFSGEMEFSSNRLKSDIESVTKNLEREIRDLSKGSREDLNSRRGEVEESLKKLNEEVQNVSKMTAREIKNFSKDVEMSNNVRFGEVENSLRRLREDVESVSKMVGKEVGDLEKNMKKNSNVELEKRVSHLDKLSDDFVKVEDKVGLERELARTKENLNGIFMKLSEEVSGTSRKLRFEVDDLSKRVTGDMKRMAEDFGKVFGENRDEVGFSLKRLEKGIEEVSVGVSKDVLELSKRIDRENKKRSEVVDDELKKIFVKLDSVPELERDVSALKNEVGDVSISLEEERLDFAKALDKGIGGVRDEVRLKVEGFTKRIDKEIGAEVLKVDSELSKMSGKVEGVLKLEKSVGFLEDRVHENIFSLKEDRKNFSKMLKEEVKGITQDFGTNIKDLSKRLDARFVGFEGELKDCLRAKDKKKFDEGAVVFRRDVEKSFDVVAMDLKNIREKTHAELIDFSRKIEREIVVLAKEIERNSLFEVNKRVRLLEKEREDFVKVGEKVKIEADALKTRNDLEDMTLRSRDEMKFSLKRMGEEIKDLSKVVVRGARETEKKFEKNSVVDVTRRMSVLEKEMDALARGLDRENEEVDILKKGFEDRLFALEKGLERVDVRVDEESVKSQAPSVSDKEIGALKDKLKDVDARVSDFEGRVDLENEKIYDRLSESLDLMMFWEKKLSRLNESGTVQDFSKVVAKKRANQVGVIRERKKVLEKLRKSHRRSGGLGKKLIGKVKKKVRGKKK